MLPDDMAGDAVFCSIPLCQVNLVYSKYEMTNIYLNMNELGQKLRKYLWIYLQKGNMFANIISCREPAVRN